jgi:hypothetical protein
MNLLQIRNQFREMSGRFDLVDALGVDTGANFYINEGSKFLDRLDETQKSWASAFRMLKVGSYSTSFPFCRAIKEVWAATTSARWRLEKLSIQDLIQSYLLGLPSSRGSGIPLYYSPCLTRYIPESASVIDLEAFIGFVEIPSGNAHNYNAILLSIPVDQVTMIDIRGLFYSLELVADTDINTWSVSHPMLLCMAAMRAIEVVNRNTQGVKDWESAISTEMTQLGMDLVEELIAEVDQMEG